MRRASSLASAWPSMAGISPPASILEAPGAPMKCALKLIYVASMLVPANLAAETGHQAWLRYPYLKDTAVRNLYAELPATVATYGNSPVMLSARDELIRGFRGMFRHTLRDASTL